MVSKQVELDLTIKDEQPAPYVMTLRKYELKRERAPAGSGQPLGRDQSLKPQGS